MSYINMNNVQRQLPDNIKIADLSIVDNTISSTSNVVIKSNGTQSLHFGYQDIKTDGVSGGEWKILNTNTNSNIHLVTTDTNGAQNNVMVADSYGKVGIGITEPATLLHLKQTTAGTTLRIQDKTNTDPNPKIELMRGDTENFGEDDKTDWRIDNNTTGNLQFHSQSTSYSGALKTRMTMRSNGNVGIGVDPGSIDALYVKSDINTKAGRFYRQTSDTGGYITHWCSDYGTGDDNLQAFVLADGDFGSRSGVYGGTSDATLKTSINPANSQIDDIKKIEVVNFKFINEVEIDGDDAKKYLGVIAQQLEECGCGSLVKEGEDGFKTVKYSILYMKAFKALQEVITENETFKTQITTQQTQIADLLARVTALENP